MNMSIEEAIKKVEDILNIQLSDEQKNIIKCDDGALVVACAGSGKTTLIVSLILRRFLTGNIKDLKKVFCSTFTKNGALEMEERINKALRKIKVNDTVEVRTLHSLYYYIIREYLGRKNINVMTESEKFSILQSILREKKMFDKASDEDFVNDLSSMISYQINNLYKTSEFLGTSKFKSLGIKEDDYKEIFKLYREYKEKKHKIDFDDMMLLLYLTFKNKPELAQKVSELFLNEFWYFFIDEFQDTSELQFEVFNKIIPANMGNRLVIVGDDDQCIYEWRGANADILKRAENFYNLNRFYLSTNYRCKSNIVEKAYMLIKNNINRYDKEIKAYNTGGNLYFIGYNQSNKVEEAMNIVNNLLRRGEKYNDIAILSRINAALLPLAFDLVSNSIPTQSLSKISIKDNIIFNDFIKVIETVTDSIITYEKTISTLRKCLGYIDDQGVLCIKSYFSHNRRPKFLSLLDYLEENIQIFNYNVRGSIQELLAASGEEMLIDIMMEGLNNFYDRFKTDFELELFKKIRRFYKSNGYNMLLMLRDNLSYLENNKDGIVLSSMHGVKGKEFKNVVLYLIEEGLVPSLQDDYNSPEEEERDIEAERRLFYVAITRVKEECYVLYDIKNPSRFLYELGDVI